MITRLIWTIWTPMSSVPKKADKLNLSLSLSLSGGRGVVCWKSNCWIVRFYFCCWPIRSHMRKYVKEGSVDTAWIGLMGHNHLPVCPLSNFRSHCFVQNPFGYYTNLLFYLILYLTLYKMLVLTCLFPKIHTPSSIGVVYIYFIIALVFIMICILYVIYCRAIALVANVTCWL